MSWVIALLGLSGCGSASPPPPAVSEATRASTSRLSRWVTPTVLAAVGEDRAVDRIVAPAPNAAATLQAALDHTPRGGVLLFREGTYVLDEPVTWRDGVVAVAAGPVSIVRGQTNTPIDLRGVQEASFVGLTFDIAAGEPDRVMINVRGSRGLRFTRCAWIDSRHQNAQPEWTLRGVLGGEGLRDLTVEDSVIDGVQLQLGGYGGADGVIVRRVTSLAPLQYFLSVVVRSDGPRAGAVRNVLVEDVLIEYPPGSPVGSGAIYVGTEIGGGGTHGVVENVVFRRIRIAGELPNPYRGINARLPTVARDWSFEDIVIRNRSVQGASNVHGLLLARRDDTPFARATGIAIRRLRTEGPFSRGAVNLSDAQGSFAVDGLVLDDITGPVWDGRAAASLPAVLRKYGR